MICVICVSVFPQSSVRRHFPNVKSATTINISGSQWGDITDRSIVTGQTDWQHAVKFIPKHRQSQHRWTDHIGINPAMTHNISIINSNPPFKTQKPIDIHENALKSILGWQLQQQVMKPFLVTREHKNEQSAWQTVTCFVILIQLRHLRFLVEFGLADFYSTNKVSNVLWSLSLTSLCDCPAILINTWA